ncbi:MAG: rhodanese-like domain-containing protein [Deltaproteobacteria bacterium]|nr:rhodanese-like domain-containing protein [Deltaproteobacteria bacterium]
MGYTNVYCFKGGIPEWRSFNYPLTANEGYAAIKVMKISPKKLYALLEQDSSIYVLDVRPIDCGRENIFIKGSIICPMDYLADWHHNIPKDAKIVVSDWTNKKSILAAKFLISKGYNVLCVLKGGIVRWRDEKLPFTHVEDSPTHDPALCAD